MGLTAHQRIALLRAGITVEPWSEERVLFRGDVAGLLIEVREDGLWDAYSGYGSPADVDRLRSAVREIVELKYWTPAAC